MCRVKAHLRSQLGMAYRYARISAIRLGFFESIALAPRHPIPWGGALCFLRCRVFVYNGCRVFVGAFMAKQKTLQERIETRIARKRGEDVFLPREFADLGGADQVLRVLRILVREKRLVRLGYGVYGRAVVSRLSGDPILYSQGGFIGAARQALTKLGVKWEPSDAERDYNEGRSTQIPVNPVVRVKGRFSRRLRDGKQELVLAR